MNEQQLLERAVRFRHAIAQADLAEEKVGREGFLRMEDFPHGACAEACTLLGLYLAEELNVEPLVELSGTIADGGKWYGSHHWLEHDGIIIDITVDQFPISTETVIVGRHSSFHERFATDINVVASSFALRNETPWMTALYQAIAGFL